VVFRITILTGIVLSVILLFGCGNETIDESAMVIENLNEEEVIGDIVERDDEESAVVLKDEDLLNHLDKTALEIIASNGYPDNVDTYQGSVYWGFMENEISFFFDHGYYNEDLPFSVEETARVTGIASSKIGAECYGTKIGMTFSEIDSLMGYKGDKGEDYDSDNMVLNYHLLKLKEGMNDIELRFYAEDDTSPSKALLIIWKGYYSEP
jgi:hypothetical protein